MTWSAFSLTHSTPHSNHRITISSRLARSLSSSVAVAHFTSSLTDRHSVRRREREREGHTARSERCSRGERKDEIENGDGRTDE